MSLVGFARDPRTLMLEGIRTDDACGFLRAASASRPVFAADLTLGSWRVHHAAADLAAQLGLPEPPYEPSEPAERQVELARRADAETAGDRATRESLWLAGQLVGALGRDPSLVCVLLPRYGAVVERHDILLVRFLAQALAQEGHRLVALAAADDAVEIPDDWRISWTVPEHRRGPLRPEAAGLAALAPGVVRPQSAAALGLSSGDGSSVLPLLGGCLLVAPEARPSPAEVAPDRFNRLAETVTAVPWLAAYAATRGSDERLDPWLLWRQASREFRSGGCDVPLALLGRAERGMTKPSHVGLVQLLAQAVRIVNQRFAEAAAVPDPAADLKGALRGVLLASKGWGLTMDGRPEEAETRLAEARQSLETDPPSDELLSLLNISALNRLKLGDWLGALAMEHRIRSALDERSGSVWQFRYINSLNLSRLHRRRRDLDAAEVHRRDAFATVAGLRSESDAIHANVLAARIAEDRGDARAAMAGWTRAALHWAASDAPEAVAPRVTAVIVRPSERTAGNACDATSLALLERLRASAAAAGVLDELTAFDRPPAEDGPAFVGCEHAAPALVGDQAWTAVTAAGSTVLCGMEAATRALRSPVSEHLRAALFALLGASLPDDRRRLVCTVLVDGRLGQEIPGSRAELLESCLRLGVRDLVEDGTAMRFDDVTRVRLEDLLDVALGPAVSDVHHSDTSLVVRFKRYRAPVELSGHRADIVDSLVGVIGVADLRDRLEWAQAESPMKVLRGLERDRIIVLRLRAELLPARGLSARRTGTETLPQTQ